jgi:preprotein translocase subunit SecE
MTHKAARAKRGVPRFRYVREIIGELKKVVWLSRRELAYLTVLVLIVSVAAGAVLGAIDYAFGSLIDKVFLGG